MSSSLIKLRCTAADMANRVGAIYTQEVAGSSDFYHDDGGFVHLKQVGATWVSYNPDWAFEVVYEQTAGAPCTNPTTDGQAYKADDGKPNWFLLMSGKGCARALAGVVRVLSFAVRSKDKGGKGYAEHSWREVPNAKERYQAALYRHLNKLELGESHDDESGESHWYHVATNALFLAELHNAEEKQ